MSDTPSSPADIQAAVEARLVQLKAFARSVQLVFEEHPGLKGKPPIVHSVRSRIKDWESLAQKITRKSTDDALITAENVLSRITDIAGVRVLHLHQRQFGSIHECIMEQVGRGDWVLAEGPRAYTWDPESKTYFEGYGLHVEVKESFYTSIHYVVKPRADSDVCCEIQVRTLFEETWGEIDHTINYPTATENVACREQLSALARLVGAGSRLADSIFRTFDEHERQSPRTGA